MSLNFVADVGPVSSEETLMLRGWGLDLDLVSLPAWLLLVTWQVGACRQAVEIPQDEQREPGLMGVAGQSTAEATYRFALCRRASVNPGNIC